MMKKIISLLLVIALTATIAIGGTVAYLTAEADPKQNVFTVGDLDITLDEKVGVIGEGGAVKENKDENGKVTGADYTQIMPGDFLQKEVTVTGDPDEASYVAVTVTLNNAGKINAAIDNVYENEPYNYNAEQIQAIYNEVFAGWGINYNPRPGAAGVNDARGVIDGTYGLPEHVLKVDFSKTTDFDNDTTMFGINNWFMSEAEQTAANNGKYSTWLPGGGYYTSQLVDDTATPEDERDYTIVYTYYAYLPAGESTTLFKGLKVPAEFNAEQLAMFDGLVIDIQASAIQADNMTDAKAAFMSLATGEAIQGSPVSDAEELVSALEEGKDVYLTESIKINPAELSNAYGTTGLNVKNGQTIDGGGNTLDISGAGGTWDSGINTTGGTIKNLTVTGSFRGIFINHNSAHSEPVILENVTIDGTVYTISCDQGLNQTLSATNCTFNGWTSYAATLGSATFKNCSFGEGSGYAFCRPYAPTTFVGCEFESGYEIDPRAAVTFENCTLGGEALTADNLATLVTSNIANATVK